MGVVVDLEDAKTALGKARAMVKAQRDEIERLTSFLQQIRKWSDDPQQQKAALREIHHLAAQALRISISNGA